MNDNPHANSGRAAPVDGTPRLAFLSNGPRGTFLEVETMLTKTRTVKKGWQRAGGVEHNLDTGAFRCSACKGPLEKRSAEGGRGRRFILICTNPDCPGD